MTLSDVMALSAGAAFALAWCPMGPYLFQYSGISLVNMWLLCGSWVVSQCLVCVILLRQFRYRRDVRPGEWLAFVETAKDQVEFRWEFSLDELLNRIPLEPFGIGGSGPGVQWIAALMGLFAILAGLAALRGLRRLLPPWTKTLVFFALVVIAEWGPLWVLSVHGPDLLAPSRGFGGSTASLLYQTLCKTIMEIPAGLLLSLPLMRMLSDRARTGRGWSWIEVGATAAALFPCLWFAFMGYGNFPVSSPGWVAERALNLAYLAVIILLGRLIDRRTGAIWRSWFDGAGPVNGETQVESSSPPSPSRSITR